MTPLLNGRRVYAGCVKPLPSEDLTHVLEHTRGLWQQIRGQRIFISGGTGFFGVWLLESLAHINRVLELDVTATVLSRDPEGFLGRMPHLAGDSSIQLIQGDVRDFSFPEGEFNCVIHGAAPTTGNATRPPAELLTTLEQGTERVLALARAVGTSKFLFLSSGAVYGSQPATLSHTPESYPGPDSLDPQNVYAEGKRAGERVCSQTAQESGIQFTIARGYTFVGPHLPLDQHFAIGNFIADALAGRSIVVRGDGSPLRSYLYAADLAIWLWTMLLKTPNPITNPAVFNVGSGEAISIRDLARVVVEELNPTLRVEVEGNSVLDARQVRYVPDVHKAEVELGLREQVTLREAIRRTAAWYR